MMKVEARLDWVEKWVGRKKTETLFLPLQKNRKHISLKEKCPNSNQIKYQLNSSSTGDKNYKPLAYSFRETPTLCWAGTLCSRLCGFMWELSKLMWPLSPASPAHPQGQAGEAGASEGELPAHYPVPGRLATLRPAGAPGGNSSA